MENLNIFINEKLKLNRNSKEKNIIVHNKTEFRNAVDDIIKKTGNNETVDLNSINVSNLVDMTRLLRSYKTIKHLDISCWDVSNAKSMAFMFPSSLETVDLTNFDVSEVQNMNGMFLDCTNLKEIGDISNWETKNLIDTNDMFSNCSSIKEIDISNWDFSKLKHADRMFDHCKNLESIGSITKDEFLKLTTYNRDTFLFCVKLKK